jgi:hypothetical protein
VTALIALRDVAGANAKRNSRTGSISYSAENAATIVGRILSDQVGRNLDRLHAQLKFRTDR